MIRLDNNMEQIDSKKNEGLKISDDIAKLIDQSIIDKESSADSSFQLNKYLEELRTNFQPKGNVVSNQKKYIIQHQLTKTEDMLLKFNKSVQTAITIDHKA